jgi:hypothetical protein
MRRLLDSNTMGDIGSEIQIFVPVWDLLPIGNPKPAIWESGGPAHRRVCAENTS